MSTKLEYKTISADGIGHFDKMMNELSDKGWKVHRYVISPGAQHYVIMKRNVRLRAME